jgi:hypothetical protein
LKSPAGRYVLAGAHFQRLFPYGSAILLTPDVLRRDPRSSAVLLKWFWNYQLRKPGSTKVLLPPNIIELIEGILGKEDRKQVDDILYVESI